LAERLSNVAPVPQNLDTSEELFHSVIWQIPTVLTSSRAPSKVGQPPPKLVHFTLCAETGASVDPQALVSMPAALPAVLASVDEDAVPTTSEQLVNDALEVRTALFSSQDGGATVAGRGGGGEGAGREMSLHQSGKEVGV